MNSIYTISHENVKIYESLSYSHIKRLWKSITGSKDFRGSFTLSKDNELLFELIGD